MKWLNYINPINWIRLFIAYWKVRKAMKEINNKIINFENELERETIK